MTECQECSIHKAFHDVAMAEKRMAEFQLNEARARCEKLRELADMAAAEQGLAQRRMMEAHKERDEAQAVAKHWKAMLRERAEELLAAREEIERLRTEAATAFRRGAEAMREAASNAIPGHYSGDIIRALPIPEDK